MVVLSGREMGSFTINHLLEREVEKHRRSHINGEKQNGYAEYLEGIIEAFYVNTSKQVYNDRKRIHPVLRGMRRIAEILFK